MTIANRISSVDKIYYTNFILFIRD